jgi:hypothetical protein
MEFGTSVSLRAKFARCRKQCEAGKLDCLKRFLKTGQPEPTAAKQQTVSGSLDGGFLKPLPPLDAGVAPRDAGSLRYGGIEQPEWEQAGDGRLESETDGGGGYRWSSDGGAYRWTADAGAYRWSTDAGVYRRTADGGSYQRMLDGGSHFSTVDGGGAHRWSTDGGTSVSTGDASVHRASSDAGSSPPALWGTDGGFPSFSGSGSSLDGGAPPDAGAPKKKSNRKRDIPIF